MNSPECLPSLRWVPCLSFTLHGSRVVQYRFACTLAAILVRCSSLCCSSEHMGRDTLCVAGRYLRNGRVTPLLELKETSAHHKNYCPEERLTALFVPTLYRHYGLDLGSYGPKYTPDLLCIVCTSTNFQADFRPTAQTQQPTIGPTVPCSTPNMIF